MKFGEIPLDDAEGAILAHTLRCPEAVLKKGTCLGPAQIAMLRRYGLKRILAARPGATDLHENSAAQRIAEACAGDGLTFCAPFTGRSNIIAQEGGLLCVNVEAVHRFNGVSPSITLATLRPDAAVQPGQLVATAKIIPFAVPQAELTDALAHITDALALAPYRALRVALVSSVLDGNDRLCGKIRRAIQHRLRPSGAQLIVERRPAHRPDAIAAALREARAAAPDLVLVFSATAIVDAADHVPRAICAVGGTIERFGMPVDPGNLLVMAGWDGLPVIGAPGCARSISENGFDLVLRRFLVGRPMSGQDIARLGVGGLLKEITSRPQLRQETGPGSSADAAAGPGMPANLQAGAGAETAKGAARGAPSDCASADIVGLILAAGHSRRMGGSNKLLRHAGERTLLDRCLAGAQKSRLSDILVVTGHMHERISAVVQSHDARSVFNPDHREGMGASIRTGIRALRARAPCGILIMLADMPDVDTGLIDRLVLAFGKVPQAQPAIIVAARGAMPGNPVLFSHHFFDELGALGGDRGGRAIIERHLSLVQRVEAGDAAFCDLDTPAAFAAHARRHPASARPTHAGLRA